MTFTFLVENIGQEDVTLTSLTDTVFGDLNGKGTCVLPQTILVGGSYSCYVHRQPRPPTRSRRTTTW